ncbi:MAG: sigma-54 dependent transcriptional regulator [Agarilytica sp.]
MDDEVGILSALKRQLHSRACKVFDFTSPQKAIEMLSAMNVDVFISDQRMPGEKGTDVLRKVREVSPNTLRVILSGYADFDEITSAFNEGSIHKFIAKPWDDKEILSIVSACEENALPKRTNEFHGILTCCERIFQLFDVIRKAASANVPVFIYGETGSGKELVAKSLHYESSRKNEPFVAFNCANFNGELMESQIFGHKKGSFTGASDNRDGLLCQAGGGTLFLDETTTMSLEAQAKLLRVLQEREYMMLGDHQLRPFNAQVIAASSESLVSAVTRGQFREDLRYRLEVIPISMPPLRERKEDVEFLLLHYLNDFSPQKDWSISSDARKFLNEHPWPGNVRQLVNVAQFIAAMSGSDQVQMEDLPENLKEQGVVLIPEGKTKLTFDDVQKALDACNQNKTKAAKMLGISRMTLWRRLEEFNQL